MQAYQRKTEKFFVSKEKKFGRIDSGVDPAKLFFSVFFFFGVKLGHFTINKFFSVCNKNASLPAKNGEILR